MGVSATGQRISASAVRHGLATALVVLSLFYYLYGPSLTERMSLAAHDRCNHLTGDTYRDYTLHWRTTTLMSVDRPHWECLHTTGSGQAWNLGWWVGL